MNADERGCRGLPPDDDIIDERMAVIMREKTEWERLEIAFGMWRFARDLMGRTIRAENPDWTEEAIQHEVASRMSHGAV
ncbi:MAG: hypothetical protein GX621_17155 [Pirellulaceae bacterium]|nr:hypothetical protein [Pirellulaceae bacterium]